MGERILKITGIASVIFTIGTALHAFVIVNEQTLARMFELAEAEPTPGFLTAFRAVGCLYIAGNAAGILALQGKPRTWLFWLVLAVNATQAVGVAAVPDHRRRRARPRGSSHRHRSGHEIRLGMETARPIRPSGPFEERNQRARTACACGPFWP